jgi:hypothetical protein
MRLRYPITHRRPGLLLENELPGAGADRIDLLREALMSRASATGHRLPSRPAPDCSFHKRRLVPSNRLISVFDRKPRVKTSFKCGGECTYIVTSFELAEDRSVMSTWT